MNNNQLTQGPEFTLFPQMPPLQSFIDALFHPENKDVLKRFMFFSFSMLIFPILSIVFTYHLLLGFGTTKAYALNASCILAIIMVVGISFSYAYIVVKEEMEVAYSPKETDLDWAKDISKITKKTSDANEQRGASKSIDPNDNSIISNSLDVTETMRFSMDSSTDRGMRESVVSTFTNSTRLRRRTYLHPKSPSHVSRSPSPNNSNINEDFGVPNSPSSRGPSISAGNSISKDRHSSDNSASESLQSPEDYQVYERPVSISDEPKSQRTSQSLNEADENQKDENFDSDGLSQIESEITKEVWYIIQEKPTKPSL